MGQIRKFVEDIKKSLSEFLGEEIDSCVLYQNTCIFSVSLDSLLENSIYSGRIFLLEAEIQVVGENDLVVNFIEFPVIGEKYDKIKITLDEAKEIIIDNLETRKLKFIFENLK